MGSPSFTLGWVFYSCVQQVYVLEQPSALNILLQIALCTNTGGEMPCFNPSEAKHNTSVKNLSIW